MRKYYDELMDDMKHMAVVDAHSHIFDEEYTLAQPADVFTRVFSLYSITSVMSSGFPPEKEEWLKDTSVPIRERWTVFQPFFEKCKETGYVKAALKTAEGLYGISDMNDDTIEELNRRIQERNQKGLFDWVMREKCNIRCVINQQPNKGGLKGKYAPTICRDFMGLLPEPIIRAGTHGQRHAIKRMLEIYGTKKTPKSAEELVEVCTREVAKEHIGIKFVASFPQHIISSTDADQYLIRYCEGNVTEDEVVALAFYLQDQFVRCCGELGLVVCVHAALNYCCGLEYRCNDPRNVIAAARRYPKTKFDIYHCVPWMRESAVMANQYPNIYLNLTWAHQISPYMVQNSLNEWLDLIPVNKIIGFGADSTNIEKTYGALCLAKENIAKALVRRMEDGMSEEYARYICRRMLYDNAVELYCLEERQMLDTEI